jgi:hypothetical protein
MSRRCRAPWSPVHQSDRGEGAMCYTASLNRSHKRFSLRITAWFRGVRFPPTWSWRLCAVCAMACRRAAADLARSMARPDLIAQAALILDGGDGAEADRLVRRRARERTPTTRCIGGSRAAHPEMAQAAQNVVGWHESHPVAFQWISSSITYDCRPGARSRPGSPPQLSTRLSNSADAATPRASLPCRIIVHACDGAARRSRHHRLF